MLTKKRIYHLSIQLFVALCASYLFLVFTAKETWLELFTKENFSSSLLYHMILAFVLMECIYLISRIINSVFDEHNLGAKRLRYQFIFGFCFVSANAFLLAIILGWIKGQNIFSTGYFGNSFVYILLFIFFVNLLYLAYYEFLKLPELTYQLTEIDPNSISELRTAASATNLPAVIYHENKASFAIDFNGEKTIWPNTIAESMDLLDPDNYFQINRKDIVHRAAILSFSPYQGRFLKIAHNIPYHKELITSKRKTADFKEWLSA